MANPILEKIDEIVGLHEEMKKVSDQRYEAIEKGQSALADELDEKLGRMEADMKKVTEDRRRLESELKAMQDRTEMLEALADRPKGTQEEQLKDKELKTWVKYMRTGMEDQGLKSELTAIRKQMSEIQTKADAVLSGTALQGGNAVPTVIAQTIEKLVLAQSDIVPEVNNVMAGSPDYNELVTIAGANGGWSSESGSRSQSNAPNLRKVTITHGELYAFPRASNWSLEDLFFDVLGWLTQDAADTMAISLSTAIYSGDGSSKPTGMTNSAPTNADDYASPMRAAAVYEYVATGASPVTTAPTVDNLIDLQVKLRRPYQPNAKWTMNSTTMGQLRKLKDSNNQYLWQPSVQVGAPDFLLGKPVVIWEDMPNYGANALAIGYGDLRRAYTLAKIGGMSMIRDNVTVPGFTNFLISQRYGGIPRNNDAFKFLKQVAS